MRPPPTVPTVSEKGRTKDKELKARRMAAYDAAADERKPAHAAWKARNGKRKAAEHKAKDAQRDWATEREERKAGCNTGSIGSCSSNNRKAIFTALALSGSLSKGVCCKHPPQHRVF